MDWGQWSLVAVIEVSEERTDKGGHANDDHAAVNSRRWLRLSPLVVAARDDVDAPNSAHVHLCHCHSHQILLVSDWIYRGSGTGGGALKEEFVALR